MLGTDDNHSKSVTFQPLLVLAAGVLIGLSGIGSQFAPGTTINRVDVSRMTVTEAKRVLSADADAYALDLLFRDGSFEIGAAPRVYHRSHKLTILFILHPFFVKGFCAQNHH